MRARARYDDRGEMLLVMAGLTAVLLGLGTMLFWQLGRSPGPTPAVAGQDAALAGATVLRQQALTADLSADRVATGTGLDVRPACAAATRTAAADGAEVLSCGLDADGLTVVTGWEPARAAKDGPSLQTSVVALVDGGPGCLAVATSWGEQLPSVCGAGDGPGADSTTGTR